MVVSSKHCLLCTAQHFIVYTLHVHLYMHVHACLHVFIVVTDVFVSFVSTVCVHKRAGVGIVYASTCTIPVLAHYALAPFRTRNQVVNCLFSINSITAHECLVL